MSQHTIQPRFGQHVLVRRLGGQVTDDQWCANLSSPLADGSMPWREGEWHNYTDTVAWSELPEEGDPRWMPRGPADAQLVPGDRYVCLTQYGGKTWVSVREYRVGWMAFPGFGGGEHVYWERVKAWMPTRAITTWHPMSDEWLKRPTKLQWRENTKKVWAARRAEALALAIINDGDEYREHWGPFSRGEVVRISRYKCSVKDVGRAPYIVDRAGMLRQRAFGWVNAWVGKYSAQWLDEDADQPCVDWRLAARYAAEILLDHYKRSYEDGLRTKEKTNASAH